MNANFEINELVIETERLILRGFKPSDLSNLYEYASVPGVGEMAGWAHHESIEKSKEILDTFIRENKVFAIVFKENGKVIGSLGIEKYGMEDALTEFDGYRGREIGYVLSKDYWGRGLMPEAIGAVINYLFNDLSLDFLTCGYYDFNNQSKKVQEKCGFKPYRKLVMDTRLGTREPGVLNLLTNPNKNISFSFSHPETLIYKKETPIRIRLMTAKDKDALLEMMRVFYASAAILSNGSEEIFNSDFENCINDSPYLEGYIFENEKGICGYAMVAKSFSTEFGKHCIWIEDLYIKEEYRGLGLGKKFFDFLFKKYTGCIFRLEVERENERAIKLYEKCGFAELPYMEMKK